MLYNILVWDGYVGAWDAVSEGKDLVYLILLNVVLLVKYVNCVDNFDVFTFWVFIRQMI